MTAATDHPFMSSADQRCPESCQRCGRIPAAHPAAITSASVVRWRDLDSEREITHRAAQGVADPTALIDHAETRARRLHSEYVVDPMTVAPRDRLREVREELADGRNHLVWWLQDNPQHDQRRHALVALRHVVLAYAMLEDTDA